MKLQQVSTADTTEALYAYWKKVMRGVPYSFDTSLPAWTRCLLEDSAAGEALFMDSQVWMAVSDGSIAGFIQFGRPSFHYDSQGRRYADPDIGVIRQLYFDRERPEVGRALLELAEEYLGQFPDAYAFYHAFGMGCQAYHGKLHQQMTHVEGMLKEHGFSVRHENVYYTVPIVDWEIESDPHLDIRVQLDERKGTEELSLYLEGQLVGSATVRYVADLTGGRVPDVAYLVWIGVARDFRGRGLGRALISRVVKRAREKGCTELHTDTALDNRVARAFYDRLGFRNDGITRDYVREGGERQ